MSINVKGDPTYVFCAPLPGKPNSAERYSPSRSRVVQSAQKGDTCAYYALQVLRNERKIGKCPLESQREERRLELIISNHRKCITKTDEFLKFQFNFSKELSANLPDHLCTRKMAQELLDHRIQEAPEEYREKYRMALTSFCRQEEYDNFCDYTEFSYYKALLDIHRKCLRELNIKQEVIEEMIPAGLDKTWEKMSLFEKVSHLENVVFFLSSQVYGCKNSSWHPEQSIEQLIQQLDLYGPLLVKGKIGKLYYREAPFQLNQQIEGRPLFGWKQSNTRINEGSSDFHAVVIVGATIQNGREFVYFMDPLDGSEPNNLTTQKIYVMSYERLKLSIANLFGMQWKEIQKGPVFEIERKEENNYGYYIF